MLQSGYFYAFDYQAWENDPSPIIIFINAIEGIHPNTGHQWRLIQALNLSYVPRKDRKRFVEDWVKTLDKTKNVKFTWQFITRRYPYIKFSIRRYMLKPTYYIKNLKAIPREKIEDAVVASWGKDFSRKLRRGLAKKFKNIFARRKKK